MLLLLGWLRTGTLLAPDSAGLGPWTELEKADAAGRLLPYGQLAMKCPVSRQLKQALLLLVTWLLFMGVLGRFWLLNGMLGARDLEGWGYVLYCIGG